MQYGTKLPEYCDASWCDCAIAADGLGLYAMQVLLLLDADFLVSKGVHEALTASDKASALVDDLTANKRVIVLPAFETPRSLSEDTGRTYALEAQSCECSSFC